MNPIVKWLPVVCVLAVSAPVFAQSQLQITTTSPLPYATQQSPYSYQMTASGGMAPYTWTLNPNLSTVPPGLSMTAGGAITGTPTQTGNYLLAIDVVDSAKQRASGSFQLSVQAAPLAITTPSPAPSGVVGVSYSFTFSASGGSPPYVWSVTSGNVPGGLIFGSDGSLTGTPAAASQFTFTVQVIDSPPRGVPAQASSKTFTLRITQPLTVTTQSPINATAGSPITIANNQNGGFGPYVWSLPTGSQLPAGFKLDPISGFLSGTPGAPGTYTFTVQVTDGVNNTATKALVIVVQPPLAISTPTFAPAGAAGVNYSLTLAATGGNPPYAWALDSGAPPTGVSLNPSTGVLSGTPQGAGAFSFVIRVTDSVKATVIKLFSLTINVPSQGALLSSRNLDFSALAGGDAPSPQNFSVISSAPQALQVSIQTDGGSPGAPTPAWLGVLILKASTPARIPVAVDQSGLPPGKYAARILVNTSDGRQNIVTVNLTVTAAAQQLDVAPGYLRFAGWPGSLAPAEQDLIVRNIGGGGPLAFVASVLDNPSWLSITPSSGQAGPNAPASLRVLVNAQALATGARRAVIHIESAGGALDVPVSLLVREGGPVIGLSLTGLLFLAREGNGTSNTKNANVLNLGQGSVNWRAEIVSGAEWLSLGASSGSATLATPSRLSLSANPGALVSGNYYALVKITDPQSLNSPQYFMAVLSVANADNPPEPEPSPSGLFFVGKTGAAPPPAQTIRVYTSSTAPVPFQASGYSTDGGNWMSIDPISGSTSTDGTAQVNVTVNPANLRPGVYTGDVTFAFSSTLIRTTSITLVVQPATAGSSSPKSRAVTGCPPARLSLTQTGLVNSFAAPAGWPSSLIVRLADDCGDPVVNGQVVATFSNGDPAIPMKLNNPDMGLYSAAWSPGKISDQMTVTARATAPNLAAATVNITGSVTPNKVPILFVNGTLNNLNPLKGAPLAPGTVAQVFGSALAPSQAEPGVVPLRTSFNGTRVLVGAFEAPLYFLSDGQLNVQIPTELQPDKDYPIIVEANGGLTLPDSLTMAPATPGVAPLSGNRLIAQHAADFSLITPDSPARQGEVITLYLVGMGATDPAVASGAAAPAAEPLARVRAPAAVTIGGSSAAIFFAGLTPGAVGLYQINLTVPTGLASGDLPVVITQNGVAANPGVLPVR